MNQSGEGLSPMDRAALITDNEVSDHSTPLSRSALPIELLVKPTFSALIADSLVDYAWISACWLGMYLSPLSLYPLWILLIAGRMHALAVIAHDVSHCPPLRQPTLKERAQYQLLDVLCAYQIGATLKAMRYHHLRHHRDSGLPTDPYFREILPGQRLRWLGQWLRGLLLVPFWSLRPLFGLCARYSPSLMTTYARLFLQDRSEDPLVSRLEIEGCLRADLGQLIWQLSLGCCLFIGFMPVVYGWLIPMWITGLLLSYRLLSEHHYIPVNDRSVETVIATTYDHHLSTICRLFLTPKNIGYHRVHHLHPQVTWRHLPQIYHWYVRHWGERYPR